jgi:tetratricopeptide (TPR) repeat protein
LFIGQKALVLEAKGNFDQLGDLLNKGLARYPKSSMLREIKLRLLHRLNRVEEERAFITEIFANLPELSMDYSILITALDQTGHPVEAQRLVDIGQNLFPNEEYFTLYRAVKKLEQEDVDGAIELSEQLKGDFRNS